MLLRNSAPSSRTPSPPMYSWLKEEEELIESKPDSRTPSPSFIRRPQEPAPEKRRPCIRSRSQASLRSSSGDEGASRTREVSQQTFLRCSPSGRGGRTLTISSSSALLDVKEAPERSSSLVRPFELFLASSFALGKEAPVAAPKCASLSSGWSRTPRSGKDEVKSTKPSSESGDQRTRRLVDARLSRALSELTVKPAKALPGSPTSACDSN
mmetsp:Transcript_90133/g.160526  ORF Transcript_90133/g.160526 Transcript_90133/m.160526 type:complete len:211 (+) Transcript_90133:41-673(+)